MRFTVDSRLKVLLFFFLVFAIFACSKNPLGEEFSQPILNAGFQLTHNCSLTAQQDQSFLCTIETPENVGALQWSLQDGSTCSWLTVGTGSAVAGTPTDDQVGTCMAIVRAVGTSRRSAPLQLDIRVQNAAPTLIIAGTTVIEDSPLDVIRADTDVQSSEEGFGTYSLSAAATAPTCQTFSQALSIDAVNGAISYRPSADFEGTCYIQVVFDDGNGDSASQVSAEFAVVVTPVNDAPVINPISAQTMSESTTLNLPIYISDIDHNLNCATSLSYTSSQPSVVPASGAVVFSGTVPNCIAAITPVPTANGTPNLTFVVSDGALSDSETFSLNVFPQNDPPAMAVIGTQNVNEDASLAIPFNISDPDDTLLCNGSVTMLTSDSSILPDGNVVFSGTAPNCFATVSPLANQFGSLSVTLVVSDGVWSASRIFTLNVASINDTPVIGAISSQTVKTDSSIVVSYVITDLEQSLDCSSSVTLTSSNTGALPNTDLVKGGTAPNCTITITPSTNTLASPNISVQVSDGFGSTVSVFSVSLVRVNSIAVSPSTNSIGNGGTQQLTA